MHIYLFFFVSLFLPIVAPALQNNITKKKGKEDSIGANVLSGKGWVSASEQKKNTSVSLIVSPVKKDR